MRKFLRNCVLFLFPIVGYLFFAPFFYSWLFESKYGPNTFHQIQMSFENAITNDYSLLILGNSRLYRGVNPDLFEEKAFNFSHDNDSYNQMYYKLKLVLDYKRIKTIIIGVDYFQFGIFSDTRNYAYSSFFPPKYLQDYQHSNMYYKLKNHISMTNPKRLVDFIFSRGEKSILKQNGQYLKYGQANDFDFSINFIEFNPKQKFYFEEILKLCKTKRINTYLVMPPSRKKELKNFSEEDVKYFEDYLNMLRINYNFKYINLSKSVKFNDSDFTDITHLNFLAADRFTNMLNDSLLGINNQIE